MAYTLGLATGAAAAAPFVNTANQTVSEAFPCIRDLKQSNKSILHEIVAYFFEIDKIFSHSK